MSWKHYDNLIVWKKAMNLVDEVYTLTMLFPNEERYALSDQMRRAAVSIPSNIAEGHERQSTKEFKQFLSIAKGSNGELETQILIAVRRGFIDAEQASASLNLCEEIRKMLTKLILSV